MKLVIKSIDTYITAFVEVEPAIYQFIQDWFADNDCKSSIVDMQVYLEELLPELIEEFGDVNQPTVLDLFDGIGFMETT